MNSTLENINIFIYSNTNVVVSPKYGWYPEIGVINIGKWG